MLHHRYAEGEGFARARGGLGNDILPVHKNGNRARLHRGGLYIALLFDGSHQRGRKA
ncbi:hypothetical protein SDC9_70780 [bioreactor metagenome]|uniref:Uncharacterized protein n=1 Tax=bioreactor metagenome TaxID=1076179 RepID=A0A644Y7L6_9ZZZZ